LVPGTSARWTILDPATLRNQPVEVRVGSREIVRSAGERPIPAFRVDMKFSGLETTSWVTDTGEVVREESPLGLMTVREPRDRAQSLTVPQRVQADLLQASAVVPSPPLRLDESRDVRLLRVRLSGADPPESDMNGVGQELSGSIIAVRDARELQP